MKLRMILEHLGGQVIHKSHWKRILKTLLEVAHSNQFKDDVVMNVAKMNVMLNHCEAKQIVPILTETILKLVKFPGKNVK